MCVHVCACACPYPEVRMTAKRNGVSFWEGKSLFGETIVMVANSMYKTKPINCTLWSMTIVGMCIISQKK